MNLYAVVAFLIGAFALLHLAVVPRARGRYTLAVGTDKMQIARRLAGLELLRSIVALALVSALLAFAITAFIGVAGGGTSAEVGSSLARVREVKDFFEQFSTGFGIVATLLIAFALWRLVRAKAAQSTEAAIKRAIELELARVRAERDAGQWEALPPSDEMRKMEERIAELSGLSEAARHMLEAGETKTEDGVELSEIQSVAGDEIARLQAEHYSLDEYRRLKVNWHPPELDAPPPESVREKIQTFFFSRGLLQTLTGTSRALFVIGALLLIPSLLAVAADPLAEKSGAQEAKLDTLYLALRQEEARKSWEEAATRGAPPPALTEADEAALDRLAVAYEQGVAQAIARVATLSTAAVPPALGAYRARQAVLQQFARTAPTEHAPVHVASAAERVGPLHDDLLAASRADADAHKPRTPEGMAFRERLKRDVAAKSADQWEKFKKAASSVPASFQRAATAAEIESALISKLVGVPSQADGIDARARSHVGADAISPETRARAFETRSHEFMNTIARGGTLDSAVGSIAQHPSGRMPYSAAELGAIKSVAERTPKVADVAQHIQAAPPSIVRDRVRGVDLAAARKAGASITTMRYGEARAVEALHHFEDMFPHHASAGGAAPGKAGAAVGNFHQARSFVALRGSRRIGGVLIGRNPEADASGSAQFNAISWTGVQDRTAIKVLRADGKTVELGPYRSRIVHQALAYAADGRPVTVTMTTAEPLAELQIQLHPALVDTPLGCRAIDLDRFVDRVTGATPDLQRMRQEANALVRGQRELYVLAWAKAVGSEAGKSWIRGNHSEIANSLAKRAATELANIEEQERQLMALALRNPPAIDNPAQSPLTVKGEFFSPLVVRIVSTCARRSGGGVAKYEDCVTRESSALGAAEFDKNTAWDAPPPTFQEWSGVREQAYKLDPELAYARTPPNAGVLWPLEFIVQLAFTSQPYGASKKAKWYDDDAALDTYEDATPWQFATLQKPVNAGVEALVKRDAAAGDIMTAMREFTVLQRFFRSAFDSRLGPRFPADTLARLAAETGRSGASMQRTARWNARAGSIEQRFLQSIVISGARGDGGAIAQRAGACLNKYKALNGFQLARIPSADWDAVCRFETGGQDASGAAPLARVSLQTSEARRLRTALKVDEDDKLVLSKQGCAPL